MERHTESLRTLGDSGNGKFGFAFEAFEFGKISQNPLFGRCKHEVCSVPLPGMFWPTVLGMVGLVGVVAWRQRHRV